MHLFFDTVWKLHIGEIPEKPHEFIDEIEQYDIWEEYRNEITTIKQNALTVGNPEILEKVNLGTCPIVEASVPILKWPGGYENRYEDVKIITTRDGALFYDTTTVRLTLPEEKKNTMENMTKEQAELILKIRDALASENIDEAYHCLYQIASPDFDKTDPWGELERIASSGSVAAPKEEGSDRYIPTTETDCDKVCASLREKVRGSNNELASLRQQLEQKTIALDSYYKLAAEVAPLKEALKELLPIAERKFNATSHREYIALKAIIDRARKLISK